MNNQNFYLRLIALLLIIMAVFFYNGTVKDKEQAQDIADLTAKTESLEKQQDQILTALKETYEEQKTAAESNASSDVSSEADNKSEKDSAEDKENADQADSEETDDSDNVYKNGTFEGPSPDTIPRPARPSRPPGRSRKSRQRTPFFPSIPRASFLAME